MVAESGIPFGENLLKPKLSELARAHKPLPSYMIDQLIRQNGNEIHRLPPYHQEFNAIELIWSQLKHIVRQRNVTFRFVMDFLFIVTPIVGACNNSMFCFTLLCVCSSIAIILMGKRELVALLNMSSWCLVMVERLFLAVRQGCL